ncbi:uncharacterized protein P884DRAFT_302619 [Thermothelomyces heterothallicus CBS 202.75]|uniref:uncharacterized protein n=1 Tax=Thermothelomyces heterothallicus CBS 202.75 TaxID=1149848 RepID=UPI003743E8AF
MAADLGLTALIRAQEAQGFQDKSRFPSPQLRADDALVKVKTTSNEGEFIAEFPPILGSETVGVVAAIGPRVTDFESRGRPLEAVQPLLLLSARRGPAV